MIKITGIPRFWGIVTLFLFLFSCGQVSSREDWEGFLHSLINRRYYDTAIEYLESFRNNPEAPDLLREELDLRIGLLTLEQAKITPLNKRKPLTDKAKKLITDSLKRSPHTQTTQATLELNSSLAQILIEEGKLAISTAEKATEAEKKGLALTARQTLDEAEQYIKVALEIALAQAKSAQENPNGTLDPNQVYSTYLSLLIQAALLPSEKARTWNRDSENYKTGMEDSIQRLHEISIKYHRYAGSFNAHFLEAKLLREMGRLQETRDILREFSLLPMEPAFYIIKTQSLLMEGEIELEDKSSESLLNFLVKYYAWKNTSSIPLSLYTSTEGLTLHLLAARSLLILEEQQSSARADYNKSLKNALGTEETPLSKILSNPSRLNAWCAEQLEVVLGQNHPLALEAEKLLQTATLAHRSKKTSSEQTFDFEEAAKAASRSWQTIIRIRTEPSPETPSSISEEQWQETENLLRQALNLVDSSTLPEKVHPLRFDLASLNYLRDRDEEAVVLANHLCHQTDYKNAGSAAKIALSSLRRLHSKAMESTETAQDARSIEEEIRHLVIYIDQRWGKSSSPDHDALVQESLLVQMQTAVTMGKIDDAKKLLERIPESSSQRAGAEIQLGQALWTTYSRETAAKTEKNGISESSPSNTKAQLPQLLQEAGTFFEKGLSRRLAASNVGADNHFIVYSALTLAHISLTQNDATKAHKWLTHPVIGPLNLVDQELKSGNINDASPNQGETTETWGENFQMSTLQLALRTFVAMGDFPQALKMMSLLELMGKGDSQRIIALYILLGKQLENQLREINEAAKSGDAAKQKELQTVLSGFEQLLEKISAQQDGNSYTTLRWVANTFLSLAKGVSGNLTEPTSQAVNYYTKAGRTYQTILRQIKADPAWANDPNAALNDSLRLVECLRSTGRYDSAFKILTEMLEDKNSHLELQVEAATLFQDWGRLDKEYYLQAIIGGHPKNGQNLVWGWNGIITRLARVLDNNPRYREIFFDAYLNKFTCRYLYARRLSDEQEVKKHASEAEAELLRLTQTHPDLGGPTFRRKFEEHLKRFRKQQGIESPIGFTQTPLPTSP